MKSKLLFTSLFAASAMFADNTDITAEYNMGSSSGDTQTIAAGDIWTIKDSGHIRMGTSTGQSATLNIYGEVHIEKGGDVLTMGAQNLNATTNIVNIDGGWVLLNASATPSIYVGKDGDSMSDPVTAQSTLNLINGAVLDANGNGGINFEVGRNSNGTVYIDSTSSMDLENGKIDSGTRSNSARALFNIDGGTLNVKNFNLANSSGNNGHATLNVYNGGKVTVEALGMSQSGNGTNTKSYVFMRDAGSVLTVTGTTNLGYNLADKADLTGAVAEMKIQTGAKATLGTVNVKDTGHITFALDSSNAASASNPMLTATNISLVKSAGETSAAIYIDGTLLASGGSFVEDETYDFILFEAASGSISLNGASKSISDSDFLDALSDFIMVENNTGNAAWKDFDVSDLFVSGNQVGISLTYAIPEPAACAAVFGVLALALAAYRRKK